MSKKRIIPTPPPILDGPDESAGNPAAAAEPVAPSPAIAPETAPVPPLPVAREATLRLVLGTIPPGGYAGRFVHLDLRLDRPESELLKAMHGGLDATGTRLRCGRRVASKADVVRWLLEQLSAQAGGNGHAATP
jgi:hypothetical protein